MIPKIILRCNDQQTQHEFCLLGCGHFASFFDYNNLFVFCYRVIGVVSNSEGFAKAFNCPKGSPMNPQDELKKNPQDDPKEKCVVW